MAKCQSFLEIQQQQEQQRRREQSICSVSSSSFQKEQIEQDMASAAEAIVKFMHKRMAEVLPKHEDQLLDDIAAEDESSLGVNFGIVTEHIQKLMDSNAGRVKIADTEWALVERSLRGSHYLAIQNDVGREYPAFSMLPEHRKIQVWKSDALIRAFIDVAYRLPTSRTENDQPPRYSIAFRDGFIVDRRASLLDVYNHRFQVKISIV